jgi:membrane-associated phospholipid phosphatase
MKMRQIMTSRNLSRLLLLQLMLAAWPVWGQEISEPDPEKIGDSQLSPPPAAAGQQHSATGQFMRDIWTDQKAIWTRPFRMNRRQFLNVALPLGAATAGLIATDTRTAKWLPNSPDQVRWSQRVSDFGTLYTLGFVTAGWMVGGKVIHDPRYSRVGRISTEALVSAILANYALKGISERERPDQRNGQGRFWKGGMSFPSGHAMQSWAAAVAIARTPKCPRWLAITSYTMATAVSLSRWSAHKHFPSDILVGAVFGGYIGNYVAGRPR